MASCEPITNNLAVVTWTNSGDTSQDTYQDHAREKRLKFWFLLYDLMFEMKFNTYSHDQNIIPGSKNMTGEKVRLV